MEQKLYLLCFQLPTLGGQIRPNFANKPLLLWLRCKTKECLWRHTCHLPNVFPSSTVLIQLKADNKATPPKQAQLWKNNAHANFSLYDVLSSLKVTVYVSIWRVQRESKNCFFRGEIMHSKLARSVCSRDFVDKKWAICMTIDLSNHNKKWNVPAFRIFPSPPTQNKEQKISQKSTSWLKTFQKVSYWKLQFFI